MIDLPTSVNDRLIWPFREELIFTVAKISKFAVNDHANVSSKAEV